MGLKIRGAHVPGLVFCAIGLAPFVIGLYLAVDRAVVVMSWTVAEAVVAESRVETKGSQHAAKIRVRFAPDDVSVETEPAHDHRYGGYAAAAEAVEQYPIGGTAWIRYDPDDPRRARLDAGFNLATFGFALLLLAAGAAFLGVGLLALRSGQSSIEAAEASSPEAAARARRREVVLVAVFVAGIGGAMAVGGAAVLPSALESRNWPVVAARVERGDVYSRTSSGSGKHSRSVTSYVARLYVSYEHEGRSFVSTLDAGSSQDRQKTERLLASIPKGELRSVRVNPRRPHRIQSLGEWPLALPVVFLVTGSLIAAIALGLLRRPPTAAGRRRRAARSR